MNKNYLKLKKEVLEILENQELFKAIKSLSVYPPNRIISFLIGAFLHPDEVVKWKAIAAFGYFTSKIAEKDMERARIIIRRLMWMLNEESGGMAWGVPEGFAEALYHSSPLKKEYLPIFVSYIWNAEKTGKHKADNFLEFPPAQRGVVWGIGRLAEKYREDLLENKAHLHIKDLLKETQDKGVMFLGLWALGRLKSLSEEIPPELIKNSLSILLKKHYSCLILDEKGIYQKSADELKEEFFTEN